MRLGRIQNSQTENGKACEQATACLPDKVQAAAEWRDVHSFANQTGTVVDPTV